MKPAVRAITTVAPTALRSSTRLAPFRAIGGLLTTNRPSTFVFTQRGQYSHHLKLVSRTQQLYQHTMASTGAGEVSLIEAAKRAACQQAVKDNFSTDFKYVGIGSGSTIAYVVEAIKALGAEATAHMKFVPTGAGSTKLIRDAGLTVLQVPELLEGIGQESRGASKQHLDIYFDGADEVDAELNCIKGGGACLFQEKVVSRLSKKFICVADTRKKADRLLSKWAYVPVEVSPVAAELVRQELVDLGSKDPVVRIAPSTTTYLITDNHNYIIDAPFPTLLLNSQPELIDPTKGVWTPNALTAKIRGILGVLEVGIFSGLTGPQATKAGPEVEGVKPVKIYFGRTDGGFETQE